jgi:hypothetical protein
VKDRSVMLIMDSQYITVKMIKDTSLELCPLIENSLLQML